MRDKSFYFKKGPRAVLLFHAYSSSPNDVRALGRALERENYTVYAPSFKGHGTGTIDDVLTPSVEDWYKETEKAYQFLKEEGHTSIAAFGLSMGGIMAVKLLQEYPLVGGGIFASPVVTNHPTNVPKHFWKLYREEKTKAGFEASEIARMEETAHPQLDRILKELREFVQQMTVDYPNMTLPLFIAQGGQDEMIDPEVAFEFADKLVNAKVDLKWYENGHHAITVGEYSKDVQQDVLHFLEQLTWNGGTA